MAGKVWNGKPIDLVLALQGEFLSIRNFGKLGFEKADSWTYSLELINELFWFIEMIEEKTQRAREILESIDAMRMTKGVLEITTKGV